MPSSEAAHTLDRARSVPAVEARSRYLDEDISWVVHAPYDSLARTVDAFVARAANDPEVLAVKHTLYRPAPDGTVVRSLARAAERGVHVVVLVELAARMGERDSAVCARTLERSGAHVVYGLVGIRTHCPVALVVAQRPEGVVRYSMVSTITPDPSARVVRRSGRAQPRPAG